MVNIATMTRLGLPKLLEFLDMSRDELCDLMVSEGTIMLEDFCDALSETVTVCEVCGNEYAYLDNGICYDCSGALRGSRNWLHEMKCSV